LPYGGKIKVQAVAVRSSGETASPDGVSVERIDLKSAVVSIHESRVEQHALVRAVADAGYAVASATTLGAHDEAHA
jgi:copper chaperone CopZ